MTPKRRPMNLQDIQTIQHSGLCDAGRTTYTVSYIGSERVTRPVMQACTCGAGLLRLMAGGM